MIRTVSEIVESAEGLVGVTFEAEGTPNELDRRLSELLKVPNRTVSSGRTGLQLVESGVRGRRGALKEALKIVSSRGVLRELAREGRLVTFRTTLVTPRELVRSREGVLPPQYRDPTGPQAVGSRPRGHPAGDGSPHHLGVRLRRRDHAQPGVLRVPPAQGRDRSRGRTPTLER